MPMNRERRSIDSNHSKSMAFDVHTVFQAFSNALREPTHPKSPIGTQDYIDGYRELLK